MQILADLLDAKHIYAISISNVSSVQIRVRERNVVVVKAKKNHPEFVYNRVYVGIQAGKCQIFMLSYYLIER